MNAKVCIIFNKAFLLREKYLFLEKNGLPEHINLFS